MAKNENRKIKINIMQTDIKLFLSSTFDEKMQEQRDYFRNEINVELNHIIGQVGKNLFFMTMN